MAKKPALTEKQIQGLILNYLATKKQIFFWRQNSGSFTEKAKAALAKILKTMPIATFLKARISGAFYRAVGSYDCASEKGLPDIIVIYKGIFVGLEVKTKTGRQRPTQKDAQAKIERAKGFYFIVRSIEDVEDALNIVENYISQLQNQSNDKNENK